MDITKEKLKVNCPYCNKKIVLTYHAESCPKCGGAFKPEDVKKSFHNYESALANNKFYQAGEKLGNAGDAMGKAGSAMSQVGCSIMMVTLFVIALLLLLF